MACEPTLRRVYWETTAACNLRCVHCRRLDVLTQGAPDELSTEEGKTFIQGLTAFGRPVLIFSGGEPLFRKDIFELSAYAKGCGLPVALSTNGTLVNEEMAVRIQEAGMYYASISLDGACPATHDLFRGPGNFVRALRGFSHLHRQGIKVQINFTVTRQSVQEVPSMYELAQSLEAYALYLFLLVPVGCGVHIASSQMLNAQEVETWLGWVCERNMDSGGRKMELRAICAPHYYRVKEEHRAPRLHPEATRPHEQSRLGCLAGIHMCFLSHRGEVFPCGYLPVAAGNIRRQPFAEIWERSSLFAQLRRPELLAGRCGVCEFKQVCGGCRARAYYGSGDVLAEEPYCLYQSASVTPLP